MKEKISRFALLSVGILAGLMLLHIVLEYILPVILPFVIAWLIAAITVKPAEKLAKKSKIPERILRLMMSLTFAVLVVTVIGVLAWKMIDATMSFISDLGAGNRFYDLITTLFSADVPFIGDRIPNEIGEEIKNAIGSALSEVFSTIAGIATSFAGSLPHVFLVLLVTLISLIYFALDYDKFSKFVRSILPEKAANIISTLKKSIFTVIGKYLLSYSLILLITFSVMFLGFTLLRVEHALLIAFIVSLLDILPVIGVGTVLIPWSIIELSVGHKLMGIGLLVLFVVNAIIRQLAEPKIVGKSLNIHPLITLVLIYVGYSLFGLVGLIILPVIAVSLGAVLKSDNSTEVA